MIKTTIQNRLFRIVTQKKNFTIVVPNRIFKITTNKKTYTVNPVGRVFKIIPTNRVYTVNAPNTVTLLAQSIKGDKGDTGDTGDTGDDGHSLLYDWDGTRLGIKLDNESSYTYTDLKGDDGGLDYTNMTLDTSPVDADVVPVNGTRNDVLSQLKISLANIKSYVLGTLFNTSSGHDHDGADSKQIAYSNITGTPTIISVLDAYPVGSIYMSVNSTNPGTLFGGTWSAWGAGRVPVGFDSSQSEFDTVEETGGSKMTALLNHNHPYSGTTGNDINMVGPITSHSDGTTATGEAWNNINNTGLSWVTNKRRHATGTFVHQHNISGNTDYSSNGNQSNGNLQPYVVCYMWKRTA